MRYDPPVAISDREREHMRRLGELKARSHAAAAAAHRSLPPAERLARSIALMRRFLGSARHRVDDPSPFYERARRLGHYRP
jgi:hypothetical protein